MCRSKGGDLIQLSKDVWTLTPFRERLEAVVGTRAADDIIRFLESQGAIEGNIVLASRMGPALESVFGKSTATLLEMIVLKKSITT